MDELLAQDQVCRVIGLLRTVVRSGPIVGSEPGPRVRVLNATMLEFWRACRIHRWKALFAKHEQSTRVILWVSL